MVETFRGGRNLLTPHPPAAYPGIRVVRPGPRWPVALIVPADGQTVTGLGGEYLLAYVTPSGLAAQGFELGAGDRARMVAWGLPGSLVDWAVAGAQPLGPWTSNISLDPGRPEG